MAQATVAVVNLLLLDADELAPDGSCVVRGRRADHLRGVLGVAVGDRVRAGVVGRATGAAVVTRVDADAVAVELELELADAPPAVLPVDLVVAVPRPKAIARVVEIAASFAIRRVDLTNAWRVDKSYLRSPRLAAATLADHARLGAEQGATTHIAPVAVHERLMALLDARWPAAGAAPRTKLIAHPGAPPIETAGEFADVALAIGPEGGWIAREVNTFVARGFQPVSLGTAILRVEAAVAAALAQLVLLRRLRAGILAP
jgi:16S rRNA (uracil1498-N3)-methyltransferase